MSQPDCTCGHAFDGHESTEDDDVPSDMLGICGVPGCPCEGYTGPVVKVEAGPPSPVHDLQSKTVVSIHELKAQPDPATISLLEDLLADARAGKVIGIAAISNDVSGYRVWSAGYWAKEQALYAFEHWKHRLLFGDGC